MSETTWNGIRVALDELEASGADPTALADLLVLFTSAVAGGNNAATGRTMEALVASGWRPPVTVPEVTAWRASGQPQRILEAYTRRTAEHIEAGARARSANPDARAGHRLRFRVLWLPEDQIDAELMPASAEPFGLWSTLGGAR